MWLWLWHQADGCRTVRPCTHSLGRLWLRTDGREEKGGTEGPPGRRAPRAEVQALQAQLAPGALVPSDEWQPACPVLTLGPPSSLCSELRTRYHITVTPRLVVLKPSGEIITDKGRKQIREQGLACFQNWVEAADVFQNFSG